MINNANVIRINKINYLCDHKLELSFNDGVKQTIDFSTFLSNSHNPLIRKYLKPEKFLQYELDNGDLQWNDYDLCFPVADLYENNI
ncbi:MAG: hypothetical protein ACI8WB_006124 [Phenylobacterium sp.]|jgi:hypothetical protein